MNLQQQNRSDVHEKNINEQQNIVPRLSSFPGRNSASALTCLSADFWAVYPQTASPEKNCNWIF